MAMVASPSRSIPSKRGSGWSACGRVSFFTPAARLGIIFKLCLITLIFVQLVAGRRSRLLSEVSCLAQLKPRVWHCIFKEMSRNLGRDNVLGPAHAVQVLQSTSLG